MFTDGQDDPERYQISRELAEIITTAAFAAIIVLTVAVLYILAGPNQYMGGP